METYFALVAFEHAMTSDGQTSHRSSASIAAADAAVVVVELLEAGQTLDWSKLNSNDFD